MVKYIFFKFFFIKIYKNIESCSYMNYKGSFNIIMALSLLSAWYFTQNIRQSIGDVSSIHDLLLDNHYTLLIYNYLKNNPISLQFLLISSSLLIDLTTLYTIYHYLYLKHRFELIVGVAFILITRQLNQFIVYLPPPKLPPLWYHPGFPSIIVTYGTENDFFYSGHTSISTFLAYNLFVNTNNLWIRVLIIMGVIYEIFTIVVTHSHYTMDIYAALLSGIVAKKFGEFVIST